MYFALLNPNFPLTFSDLLRWQSFKSYLNSMRPKIYEYIMQNKDTTSLLLLMFRIQMFPYCHIRFIQILCLFKVHGIFKVFFVIANSFQLFQYTFFYLLYKILMHTKVILEQNILLFFCSKLLYEKMIKIQL